MRNEIQTYQDQPLDIHAIASDASEPPPSGNNLLQYLDILRRRWRTVAVLWPILLVIAVAAIWLSLDVSYVATAQVEVRGGPIEAPGSGGSFESKLATQAFLMTSQKVLLAALASPRLKNLPLPLHQAADPLAAIRRMVSADHIRGTRIVELRVENANREHAVAIAWAVLDAYLTHSEDAQRQANDELIKIAEEERERLRSLMQTKRTEINELARIYGATGAAMFDLLRESKLKRSEELNKSYEQAKTDVARLEHELGLAKQGKFPASTVVGDPDRLWETIRNDPMVRALTQQLQTELDHLIRLTSAGLTENAPEVINTNDRIAQLKVKLAEAENRAAEYNETASRAMSDRMKDALVKNLQDRLDTAHALLRHLEGRVNDNEKECTALGQTGVRIQELQQQEMVLQQKYQEWDTKVEELRVESRQLSRIIVASEPEVRPDGVKDKRGKLSVVAVFGSLFFALVMALVRDRLDPCVHGPQQVETSLGIRLLGLVPSLTDLKEGRITEGEFAESYRLVRACLAVAGPDGAPPKSILATSAQACEGKTSLAVSLAASLAEAGHHVLLIDGDIQGPQIERALRLTGVHTLKEVLTGEVPLSDAVVHSGMAQLDVLVARLNSSTARGVLNPRTAIRLIREAAAQYDYVIVDSPPALGAADAVVWAEAVDGVILSSFAGQSDSHAMRLACQRLRSVGARILGAVMCNLSIKDGYYSYSTSAASARSMSARRDHDGGRTPPHVQLPVVEIYPSETDSRPQEPPEPGAGSKS